MAWASAAVYPRRVQAGPLAGTFGAGIQAAGRWLTRGCRHPHRRPEEALPCAADQARRFNLDFEDERDREEALEEYEALMVAEQDIRFWRELRAAIMPAGIAPGDYDACSIPRSVLRVKGRPLDLVHEQIAAVVFGSRIPAHQAYDDLGDLNGERVLALLNAAYGRYRDGLEAQARARESLR